jgi:hypothetical protein
MDFVRVTSAQVLGHYRLRIGFSDGSSRDVDLTGELRGPVFEPLADADFFAQVRVTTTWGPSCGPMERTSIPLCCTATSSRPHASFIADRPAAIGLRARHSQTTVSGD